MFPAPRRRSRCFTTRSRTRRSPVVAENYGRDVGQIPARRRANRGRCGYGEQLESGMARTDALTKPKDQVWPQVAAVQSLRLSDGRVLCARRWAGTDAETVVVLHGLLDSSEGWTALSERITCNVVAFDLPGFGYSDPARQGSVAGYACDVAEGLALLGVERFTLIGHSLGGAVATALAELVPDKVAALVLLAPAGFGRIHLAEAISVPGIRNVIQAGLPFVLSNRLAVTVGYMTMVANGKAPGWGVVDRVTSRAAALVDGAREGTRAVVVAGRRGAASGGRRAGYRGPVVAVWGDRDRLVPVSHRHGVRTAYPQARIEIWRGMGHHPLAERFDELTAVIGQAVEAARVPIAGPPMSLAQTA